MSLDLTRAENADRHTTAKWSPAKTAANRKATILMTIVFLLLLAAAFGVLIIGPIRWY